MTTQIAEEHLRVDNQWDLVLNLGEGWNSNGAGYWLFFFFFK